MSRKAYYTIVLEIPDADSAPTDTQVKQAILDSSIKEQCLTNANSIKALRWYVSSDWSP